MPDSDKQTKVSFNMDCNMFLEARDRAKSRQMNFSEYLVSLIREDLLSNAEIDKRKESDEEIITSYYTKSFAEMADATGWTYARVNQLMHQLKLEPFTRKVWEERTTQMKKDNPGMWTGNFDGYKAFLQDPKQCQSRIWKLGGRSI
jgi:hypothetical protein